MKAVRSSYRVFDEDHAIEFHDGRPVLSFWFSDCGPLPDSVEKFVEEVTSDRPINHECSLEVCVPLSNVVDGLIEARRYMDGQDRVSFPHDDRPLVAATRAALQLAIDKLDAIEFTDGRSGK